MIYVVAGGPSLKDFDWSYLNNRRCIAVNRAYQKVPKPEAIYFSDNRIWEWYGSEMLKTGAKIYSGMKVKSESVIPTVFTGMKGLEEKPYKLKHGNNSGYAAINLAYHLIEEEATPDRRIVLLGFDMAFIDGRSNWHDGYKVRTEPSVYGKMIGNFDLLAQKLLAKDYIVINANLESKLDCFSKCAIGAVF